MLRKRNSSWSSYTVLTVVIVCLAAGSASAQITQDEPTDTYQVTYYSNALSAPYGTVHIVNPGTAMTKIDPDGRPLNGNLCADIYVLNNDQQVVECCGCQLTPDAEKTLSIYGNLLSNPINPGLVTTDGVIKAVSAATNNNCNPSVKVKPTAALRLWATHIQVQPWGSYPETEEEFAAAPLSVYELSNLENQCSAIVTSGSGHGICTCGI